MDSAAQPAGLLSHPDRLTARAISEGFKRPEKPTMTVRKKADSESYSVGQLARRWGVSPDRIRGLIDSGHIPRAFRIPSAGRFGTTLKIPKAVIEQLESDWQVSPATRERRRTQRPVLELRHLTGLMADPESDAECPGAGHD